MSKKSLKTAVTALARLLERQQALEDSIKAELQDLRIKRENIEQFIQSWEGDKLAEVPAIVLEQAPYMAWLATEPTDGSTIAAHMQIDDNLIPSIENERKALKARFEEQLKMLEGYMLQRLEQNQTSSTSVAGVGRAEKRLEVKYSIPDKALLAQWAVDNDAAGELTISLRPNSKFMAKVVEENGELPPGVSMTRNYKCVMVKG